MEVCLEPFPGRKRRPVPNDEVVQLSGEPVRPALVVMDEFVQTLKKGAVVHREPPIPVADYLEVMDLVSRPESQDKAAGHAKTLSDEEEAFSSAAGARAQKVGRVLSRYLAMEPPVGLCREAHVRNIAACYIDETFFCIASLVQFVLGARD